MCRRSRRVRRLLTAATAEYQAGALAYASGRRHSFATSDDPLKLAYQEGYETAQNDLLSHVGVGVTRHGSPLMDLDTWVRVLAAAEARNEWPL